MPNDSRIAAIPPRRDGHAENECRAAALNAVLVRCRQNGRGFFTTEDAHAADLMFRTLLKLETCGDGVREGAPQTMPCHPEVSAFAAVERALYGDPDLAPNGHPTGVA